MRFENPFSMRFRSTAGRSRLPRRIEQLESRLMLSAAGDLDPTFGDGGIAIEETDFGTSDQAEAVAVQSDGKIVVAGFNSFGLDATFGVYRFNTDGTLDSSFGDNGQAFTDISPALDEAAAMVIQRDGKIVLGGFTDSADTKLDFALVRYNTDGSLDSTFGTNGLVTTNFVRFGVDGNDSIAALAIQEDNKIVAAGTTANPSSDFAVARYNEDGTLDKNFGTDGRVITNLPSNSFDLAFDVLIQSDGKVVVGGNGGNATLVRYESDGTLDSTFGVGGITTVFQLTELTNANAVAIQEDGKILLGGSVDRDDYLLVRFDANGVVDPTFGELGLGLVQTDFGSETEEIESLVIQDDGKIVAAGIGGLQATDRQFAALRYNSNGSLDDSFGTGGLATADLGAIALVRDVALDNDGNILVAGSALGSSFDFTVVRFLGEDLVNAAPQPQDDIYSTNENTTLIVDNLSLPGLLANDIDPEGDPLSVIDVTQPGQGSVTFNADGTFEYSPLEDFFGQDAFSYTMTDGTNSAVANVTIDVLNVNTAPMAVNDSYTIDEDTTLTVDGSAQFPSLLSNDSDADGDFLSIENVTQPTNGNVTFQPDGTFEYIPDENFFGTDTFTYTISDGTETQSAEVSVEVLGINDPPQLALNFFSTPEDQSLGIPTVNLLSNAQDPDGDPLTVVSFTQHPHGVVFVGPNGSLTFTPDPNYFSTLPLFENTEDVFTYTVSDGTTTVTQTAVIGVSPVNDPPSFTPGPNITLSRNTGPIILRNWATDILPGPGEDDQLTFDIDVFGGIFSELPQIDSQGTLTFTPSSSVTGSAFVVVGLEDGQGGRVQHQLGVVLLATQNLVAADDDQGTTDEDSAVTIDALTNDEITLGFLGADINGLPAPTDVPVAIDSGALVTVQADGRMLYDPNGQFEALDDGETATDSFIYTIRDSEGKIATAVVEVTVNGLSDLNTANDDLATIFADQTIAIDLAANDILPNPVVTVSIEGEVLPFGGIASLPSGALVGVQSNLTLTYDPNDQFDALSQGESVTEIFEYTLTDLDGNTATANVVVTIDGRAELNLDFALDEEADTDEDTPITISVLVNDVLTTDGTVQSLQKISESQGTPDTLTVGDFNRFGSSIANIGDLNGDGVTDLAVGVPQDDDGDDDGSEFIFGRGAVYILFMNADRTVGDFQKISDTQGTPETFSLTNGNSFGASVTFLGDLNEDGHADIAVGASGDGVDFSRTGAVYVLFLDADATVKSFQKISSTEGTPAGFELEDQHNFGESVTTLGDVDGDGIVDIAVGAIAQSSTDGRGEVRVLFLNRDGTVKNFQSISDTEGTPEPFGLRPNDQFGRAINAIGDLDGDGISELVAGAAGFRDSFGVGGMGAVFVLFLNPDGTVREFQEISDLQGTPDDFSLHSRSFFGISVSSVGDLNGDGISDLAVGAADESAGLETFRGGLYVLFLNRDGTVNGFQEISEAVGTPPSFTLEDNDSFGVSVTAIRDENSNGLSELVVGATGDGDFDTGAVYFLALNPVETITKINDTNVTVDTTITLDSGASATLQADGRIIYDPNGGFDSLVFGELAVDSFTYTLTNALGQSDTATVTVTISGLNDRPVAASLEVDAQEDGRPVSFPFAGSDADDDAILTFNILSQPNEGQVINNGDGTFRFVPGSDFQELAEGEVREVAFDYTATDQFGAVSEPAAITVRVTGINDAPEPTADGAFPTTLTEDDVDNFGDRVSDIVAGTIVDIDNDSLLGMAIINVIDGGGNWQFSIDNGLTWQDVGTVSDTSALLVGQNDWLRYQPNGKGRSVGFIDYRAWDQTTSGDGQRVDVTRNGGTSAFSVSVASAEIEASDVNDAPVLDTSLDFLLDAAVADESQNLGTSVADLLVSGGMDPVTDVDAGALTGIAVTSVDNFFGTWQFSTDAGTIWENFQNPSSGEARLLSSDPDNRVRYLPNPGSTESSSFRFRAWDQSDGRGNGTNENTIPNGGISAYSNGVAEATVGVVETSGNELDGSSDSSGKIVVGAEAGQEPRVTIFDAATGLEQDSFLAFGSGFLGGVRVATADVNGDGVSDIIAAAGPGGGPHVMVFSGVDGRELISFFAYDQGFSGGLFVAAADLTGDGRAEIITGPDVGGGPHVVAFDLATITQPYSFLAYDGNFTGGVRVAAGDVTGDGVPDIITGAGPGGGPHVMVYDGSTGLLDTGTGSSFFAYDQEFRGGIFVTAADFNDDGRTDIVTAPDQGGGPHVRVFDAVDAGEILSLMAFDQEFLGGVRVAAGDVTGDTIPDIITAPGPGIDIPLRVFDGSTGSPTASPQLVEVLFPNGLPDGGFVALSAIRPDPDQEASLIESEETPSESKPNVVENGLSFQPQPDDLTTIADSIFSDGQLADSLLGTVLE